MTVWVVRISTDGESIGEPHVCATPGHIIREPGMPTIEEQIAILLSDGETVDDRAANGRLRILSGSQLSGFIEVLDESPSP
jgi:hypothetical protein